MIVPARPFLRIVSPVRLAAVLGVWIVVAGGAIMLALALDAPVGEGARDAARPAVPGPVAAPGEGLAAEGLPPLALILDRPPPPGVAALGVAGDAERLRELASGGAPTPRLVEVGTVLQLLGDGEGAEVAYRAALERAPDEVEARVGLAMVDAARDGDGLERATAVLDELARRHPESQLVAFNRGWLAIYARRAGPARRAWTRAVALGEGTRLGRTAARLLAALDDGPSGRDP